MAPTRRLPSKDKSIKGTNTKSAPPPYKEPPTVLRPFIDGLSKKHVYITHIDSKPASFKRNMFLVPVAINVVVVAFFLLRMRHILPWYWTLLLTGFGHPNDTFNFDFHSSTWSEFAIETAWRTSTLIIDFLLVVFVWPWPIEFVAATAHGNPSRWRWHIGFREKEIYVRRSRDWDTSLGEDFLYNDTSKRILKAYVETATNPMLQEQKTGYLLMNGSWNLDWDAMIHAHGLVDAKEAAIEAFQNVVLIHHRDFGWLSYDIKTVASAFENEKRRQVFAFRDALVAMDKENLFYRWIEIVQYEATQPGGFGPEKQEAAAKQIRELFEKENINFDELWQQTVGPENGK